LEQLIPGRVSKRECTGRIFGSRWPVGTTRRRIESTGEGIYQSAIYLWRKGNWGSQIMLGDQFEPSREEVPE